MISFVAYVTPIFLCLEWLFGCEVTLSLYPILFLYDSYYMESMNKSGWNRNIDLYSLSLTSVLIGLQKTTQQRVRNLNLLLLDNLYLQQP